MTEIAPLRLPGLGPTDPLGQAPTDDELAAATVLAQLPGITPARLRRLVMRHGPVPAVELLARGDALLDDPWFAARLGRTDAQRRAVAQRWAAAARACDPGAEFQRCQQAGMAVWLLGRPGYPPHLAADPDPPAVLFVRGDLAALDGRRVAVIGTRNATAAGRATAVELGGALAHAAVRVVSGLARGIDGAAHRGALAAGDGTPVIGVVGSGLDIPYPREHERLWAAVAERGVLVGEAPPGAAPEGWRFPLRNRILAALAEIVVVVESRQAGGSLVTVDAAITRGVPVMAVPGSVRNRAAAGTNQLIADGCAPVRDVVDVLVALGLATDAPATRRRRARQPDDPIDAEVLELFGADPLTLDEVVAAAGRPLAEVAVSVGRLEQSGWLERTGGWFERAEGAR